MQHPIIRRILAMKFANEFMLIFPLFPIMFGERGAIDAAGVGILLAALAILTVLFEVPTGIIADKVSRKYVMLAAILARTLCMLSWLLMPNFWGYMIGVALLALGSALESGALQAYLYGALGRDVQLSFGKFWSRVSAMTMLSWSLAYVLATIIGVRYDVILVLSGLSTIIAAVVCLTLPKDDIHRSGTEVKPKIFKTAVTHIVRTIELRSLLLIGIVVTGLALVTIEYIGLYYSDAGVSTRYVPLVMAGGNLIGAVMFWTLHSWEHILDRYKLWLTLAVLVLFALSLGGGVVALCAGFLLVARFLRILQIQFEARLQHLSNDKARATISSLASFASNIVAGVLMLAVGFFAVAGSILAPIQILLLTGTALFGVLHLIRVRMGAGVVG